MAADEIMMHVSGKKRLAGLRQIFLNTEEDALDLEEFVQVMLPLLPKGSNRVEATAQLMDLFAEIDVNGDGDLEWDEFTSYCIEAAIATTRRAAAAIPAIKYVEPEGYRDHTTRGSSVRFMQCLPPPRQNTLLVLEQDIPLVRLYDADTLKIKQDINLLSAYSGGTSTLKTLSPLCVVVNTQANFLAVSSSDHTITFWDMNKDFAYFNTISVMEPQVSMAVSGTDLLFASSMVSPTVTVFDTRRYEKLRSFKPHLDLVSSLLVLPSMGLLLTGSGDKTVGIFDVNSLKRIGRLVGHSRGIRKMLYSPEWKMLLTVSFETTVYGWQLSNQRHTVTLRGHSHAVMDVAELRLPNRKDQPPAILTLDERGIFKIWDLGSGSSGLGTCLFTVEVPLPLGVLRSSAMTFMPSNFSFIAARDKLHPLRPVPLQDGADPPIRVVWNPVTYTFSTIAGSCVRLYDMHSNKIETFIGVVPSTITAVCLDDRKRKMCVGMQSGGVAVISAAGGVVMKTAEEHHSKEVTAMKYVDMDKLLVTVSWDRQLLVFDEEPAAEVPILRSVHDAHSADITSLAVSRDLSLIATGAANAGLRVWNLTTCELLYVLKGHSGAVSALQFLDPYPVLASASHDGELRLWAVRGASADIIWDCIATLSVIPGRRRPTRGRTAPPLPRAPVESLRVTSPRSGDGSVSPGVASQQPKSPGGDSTFSFITEVEPVGMGVLTEDEQRAEAEAHETDDTLHKLILVQHKDPVGVISMHAMYYPGGAPTVANATLPDSLRHTEQMLIVLGDELGFISTYDVLPVLHALRIRPLPDSKKLHTLASYAPQTRSPPMSGHTMVQQWRLEHRDSVETDTLYFRRRARYLKVANRALLVSQWKAHSDHITDVTLLADPVCIVSTSLDFTTRTWYVTGGLMGMLCMPKRARMLGAYDHIKWRFQPDIVSRTAEANEAARQLLEEADRDGAEGDDDSDSSDDDDEVPAVPLFQAVPELHRRRTRIDSVLSFCVGLGRELAAGAQSGGAGSAGAGAGRGTVGTGSVARSLNPELASTMLAADPAPDGGDSDTVPSTASDDDDDDAAAAAGFALDDMPTTKELSAEEALERATMFQTFEEQYGNLTAVRSRAEHRTGPGPVVTTPSSFLSSRLNLSPSGKTSRSQRGADVDSPDGRAGDHAVLPSPFSGNGIKPEPLRDTDHVQRTYASTAVPQMMQQMSMSALLHSPVRVQRRQHPCVSPASASRPATAPTQQLPPARHASVSAGPLLSPVAVGPRVPRLLSPPHRRATVALVDSRPRASPLAAIRAAHATGRSPPGPSPAASARAGSPSPTPTHGLTRKPSALSLRGAEFMERLEAVADGLAPPAQPNASTATDGYTLSHWDSVHSITHALKWPSTTPRRRRNRTRPTSPSAQRQVRVEPSRSRMEARRKAQELMQKRAGVGPSFGYYQQQDVRFVLNAFRAFDPTRSMEVDLREFLPSQTFKDIVTRLPDISATYFETAPKRDGYRIRAEHFIQCIFPAADDGAVDRMLKYLKKPSASVAATSVAVTAEQRHNLLQVFKQYDASASGAVDLKAVLAGMPYVVRDHVSEADLRSWCRERGVNFHAPVSFDGFVRVMRDVLA